MSLVSDPATVGRALGRDPLCEMLLPSILLDGPRWAAPLLLQRGRERILLCRDIERGNVEAAAPRVPVAYHTPYYLVEADDAAAPHDDVCDALDALAGDAPLQVDDGLPYGLLLALGDRVAAHAPNARQPVDVHEVPHGQAQAAFRRFARDAEAAAARVAGDRELLRRELPRPEMLEDSRFARLDGTLEALGCEAVLASSDLTRQELLGTVAQRGWLVVARRGDDAVHVIAPAGHAGALGSARGSFASIVEAVGSLVGEQACLAIEDRDLPVGLALALREAELELVPATVSLSRWREARAYEDLPFSVIAAQASRFAMEGALDMLARELSAEAAVSELDVYHRYVGLLAEFRRQYAVPFAIEPYFTSLHAADRSSRPARPTPAAISPQTPCVKFDAGVLVKADGLVLGGSDLARMQVNDPDAKGAVALLTEIVRSEALPQLREGQTGAEVHASVTAALDRHRVQLAELGLHPGGEWRAAERYARNVGHLMGKEESLVTEFAAGAEERLHDGAIMAVEIVWVLRNVALASEEMAVLIDGRAIRLSA